MREYYEELWERIPSDGELPELARRREFLRAHLRQGDRALDLGCGLGTFTAIMKELGARPVGVEVAESALRRARSLHPGLEFRLARIDGPLPLEDCSFELVWASDVIEHIADTARWLSEVRRVLVPGGRLLITTPNHSRLGFALRGVERFSEPLGDHLHLYTKRSLTRLLEEFAFSDIAVFGAGGVPLARQLLLARAAR